jgi:hypothetical protein
MAAQDDVSDTPTGKALLFEPQPPQRNQDSAAVAGAHEDADPQPEDDGEPDQSFLSVLLRALSTWST